ncbi:MAG TPA: GNAT family N-acetyltransferase [Bosea sp. (in: a-proteobacteria)]|jgi:CelD/BcsL family acetyltransferase involved in cellulose biosynthesis|uniref:GNAT family N-acetyltransferase n=1 Tax=Bosea sp. (in: a-proteobacteria) TaxID=1871050 RepID=UPI002DDDB0E9|nr:GNAT family N-acetyltransferase [Bosea sp. (in: a-proteobacteria)]HEV2556024.1 GNAT family N-acetyltransferase [Bosea sp. (in: a-proteobacteria)]
MSALVEPSPTAPTQRRTDAPVARASGTAKIWASLSVVEDIAALAEDWRALEDRAVMTPYQAYGWVRPFTETVGAAEGMAFRHAVLRDAGGVALAILPLVITRRSGIRFAEFIGGKHANYHMGIYDPAFAAGLDAAGARLMLAEIGAAIGGLDAFIFVNQPTQWQGVPNPLAQLAGGPSPSGAYKLALMPGDGEGSLRRSMSSHAHKKLKNKRNRFVAYGPSEMVRARTPAEIARVIDAFLRQKAARFAMMGIADPFAPPAVRRFLERGAQSDGDRPPVLELYSLDVGGQSVATYVGAVQAGRFSGMATSFAMDSEVAKTSPGEILLVDLIRLKSREGITVFDLGVGEARYKTTICDERDDLVDSFLPLTARGHAFALFSRAKREAKRRIKASPVALKLAHRVSGWLSRGRKPAADE